MTRIEVRTTTWILAGLLAAGLAGGCSRAPRPTLPPLAEITPPADDVPANVREAAREAAAKTPEPASAQAPDSAGAADSGGGSATPKTGAAQSADTKVIVIERAKSKKGTTLVEAAEAARASRAKAGPSVASVTNENLKDYQDAELTFAQPAPASKAKGAGSAEAETPSAAAADKGEEYWRSRVLDLRLALRGAVDQLDELETKAAGLRRSFYAEDDPYVRDGQIKPAWDRALDRLAETRKSIHRLQDQLAETLDEGRRAGALPGWLRAGIELEPTPEELPPEPKSSSGAEPSIYEPEEPKVLDEPAEPPPISP